MFLGWMVIEIFSPLFFTSCKSDLFSLKSLGVKKKCHDLGIEFLGDVPLHARICSDADAGKPTVVASPESPQAAAFAGIAEVVAEKLSM